ncbi:glycosyl hydrolase [Cupriavidus sp. WGlv3]|uniref:glycosyl hydrolase n=1 Tax=Cupriavidus sp. WGlv3 TaxID=2919924 RepID=UPI002091B1D3|nr:glycosyl hydrolase [Cupriavidus sp. WGlv3]MCO4861047.1 glycosyl hydrolase [Cupriavidus sp. WGlv3]
MTTSPTPETDTGPVRLLVATTKGAWYLTSDGARRSWQIDGPTFLGHTIHHIVQDPREPSRLLMAARTGHLGPTVFRSTDGGRNWTEAARPPAFDKVPEGETGRVVDHVFWLTPGHASEPGTWYAGTSPQGLFRSADHGASWEPVSGFNDHPMWRAWTGGEQDGTPDGPKLHSVLVDPRDARHLYIGMSSGGVFESTDAGADWKPLNRGSIANFLPDPNPEYGQDPHCMLQHPANPDILYQQNHCGIYRMDRREGVWKRIGEAMPAEVGDIGFPIVAHRRDPRTVWVFPMDGSDVWPRVSPGGRPAAYVTRDGGETWQRQDRGLPAEQSWFTVKRQAMATDGHEPVGVYFGTTGGELWASADEGAAWQCIARNLPQIYAVSVARPA